MPPQPVEKKQMTEKILIMGLPGTGKTFLANALKTYLEQNSEKFPALRFTTSVNSESVPAKHNATVTWFNADEVRKKFNDWDFSREGRIRQSLRMAQFALTCNTDFAICDFVAPLVEMRNNFKADWTIWMDTEDKGRFEDTNKAFIAPEQYDFRVTEKDCEKWAAYIGDAILAERRRPVFDSKKPTVQLLGRYQPWHAGHRALFEKALEKTGQVCIMIRDTGGSDGNPFDFEAVGRFIKRDLDPLYQGQYDVVKVPNIVNITYGRDVGYSITQETLTDELHAISATQIRKEMGL
jgi:hypothetical protein